jgi:peptide/nickel transport system ATP-binding protein
VVSDEADIANARHPYTRGLMNARPRLEVFSSELAVVPRDPAWLASDGGP